MIFDELEILYNEIDNDFANTATISPLSFNIQFKLNTNKQQ
jgi:hypothetical protein